MIFIEIKYEEALKAFEALEEYGIYVEFIDDNRILVEKESDFEVILDNENIVWNYID